MTAVRIKPLWHCRLILSCTCLLLLRPSSVAAASPSCAETGWQREIRYTMGSMLEIAFKSADCERGREILENAFRIAQDLDSALSNYKDDSEVSRLNRTSIEPTQVSLAVYEFLQAGKQLSNKTGGAFDLTVGPLVNLWRDAEKLQRLPSRQDLAAALAVTGSNKLELLPDRRVKLTRSKMCIDSGGLGKGFAVDRIGDLLKSERVKAAYINFGQSSVLAFGLAPDKQPWKVLVPFPIESPIGAIELNDAALSVSGTRGRSREIAGKTFGHIVDPRDGMLLSRPIQAVVITSRATDAEALTKLVVLRGIYAPELSKFTEIKGIARVEEGQKPELSSQFEALRAKEVS